jgi:hypothetical protein
MLHKCRAESEHASAQPEAPFLDIGHLHSRDLIVVDGFVGFTNFAHHREARVAQVGEHA